MEMWDILGGICAYHLMLVVVVVTIPTEANQAVTNAGAPAYRTHDPTSPDFSFPEQHCCTFVR